MPAAQPSTPSGLRRCGSIKQLTSLPCRPATRTQTCSTEAVGGASWALVPRRPGKKRAQRLERLADGYLCAVGARPNGGGAEVQDARGGGGRLVLSSCVSRLGIAKEVLPILGCLERAPRATNNRHLHGPRSAYETELAHPCRGQARRMRDAPQAEAITGCLQTGLVAVWSAVLLSSSCRLASAW